MEELIQKIINIDDKTKTLVSQSREREASLRDDLNQSLDQLESSSLTQAREKALSSYEKTYSDLMDQVNKIRQENHQRLAEKGAAMAVVLYTLLNLVSDYMFVYILLYFPSCLI